MADSLFDNRYRYDYIYPRGRSGETLRAYDTAQNDRLVVIKRPAPNDAPPIRAGQEVSILNERKALKQLAGHPVLTAFLGDGQFNIGGMPHQYIVIERAEGLVIADVVLELARKGGRLPQLEMLMIADSLLDLLSTAHSRDIVYNDVDAKHLFWDRSAYRLKVIDWGNAVFLDGESISPQGISKQSDIFQVAELLFFILSGGRRMDVPRDAGDDFALAFGDDEARVAPRLRAIISKAAHPNPKFRYANIPDLRRDLTDYRKPIERERDTVVNMVIDRLRKNLSKTDIEGLLEALEPVLAQDSGFPAGVKAQQSLLDRARDLEVSAELDAVRIYAMSGNWGRAGELLNDLKDRAGTTTRQKVFLLADCASFLKDMTIIPALQTVMNGLFDEQYDQTAHALMTDMNADDELRGIQWRVAERMTAHIPQIKLLHPNLYRVRVALRTLQAENVTIGGALGTLDDLDALLAELSHQETPFLPELAEGFFNVTQLQEKLWGQLGSIASQTGFSENKLPRGSLERAQEATHILLDNLQIITQQATTSPREALMALDVNKTIDPTSPVWEWVGNLLNALYQRMEAYQSFIPSADGADIEAWLTNSRKDLIPFIERLSDPALKTMAEGFKSASTLWGEYGRCALQGNREGAVMALDGAIERLSLFAPTLAQWLNQLHGIVENASYVERHSLFGGLGRALADGWEAFDRGRLADAERLGQHALEIARNETERAVAQRLFSLCGLARDWSERESITSRARTQTALEAVTTLFTPQELAIRKNFTSQMPSRETYLRAMQKGLIENLSKESAPALRILFFNNILQASLEAHDANLNDARFWREVAVKLLGDYGARHVTTRQLDEFIEKRRVLNSASEIINRVNGKHALETLEITRRQLEDNPEARPLAPLIQSLRDLENALKDWADGEFKPAGMKLETAIKSAQAVSADVDINLNEYLTWLNELQAACAELHTRFRQMRQLIERRPDAPVDAVHEAHYRAVTMTTERLGENYAAQLLMWHETYVQFLSTYTDITLRRSGKLARFNELFKAMFIDRHPAYTLYRHWYDITDNSPEFPAPPTTDPTPRLDENADGEVVLEDDDAPISQKVKTAENPLAESRYNAPRKKPMRWIIPLAIFAVAIGIAGAILLIGNNANSGTPDSTLVAETTPIDEATAEPTAEAMATLPLIAPVEFSSTENADVTPENTLPPLTLVTPTLVTPEVVVRITDTPSPIPPTNTPAPTDTPIPTNTPVPTETPIPTLTFTPTVTPTATLPAQGLQGWQNLITLAEEQPTNTWDTEKFAPADDVAGAWRLGVGEIVSNDDFTVTFDPELLNITYGNDAASRIRRVEATFSLITYDPRLVDQEAVYFGVMLQSVNRPELKVGLHIQVVNLTTLNLWLQNGDERTFILQRSVNSINPRLRLERDDTTGYVTAFLDDFQVGEPMVFVAPEAFVTPAVYVRDGGVLLNLLNWRMWLR
jgi:serine/threonine protein kinase